MPEMRWVDVKVRKPAAGKTVKVKGIFASGIPFESQTIWAESLGKWGGVPCEAIVCHWEEEVPPPPPLKERAKAFLEENEVYKTYPRNTACGLIRELLGRVGELEEDLDEADDYPDWA